MTFKIRKVRGQEKYEILGVDGKVLTKHASREQAKKQIKKNQNVKPKRVYKRKAKMLETLEPVEEKVEENE